MADYRVLTEKGSLPYVFVCDGMGVIESTDPTEPDYCQHTPGMLFQWPTLIVDVEDPQFQPYFDAYPGHFSSPLGSNSASSGAEFDPAMFSFGFAGVISLYIAGLGIGFILKFLRRL